MYQNATTFRIVWQFARCTFLLLVCNSTWANNNNDTAYLYVANTGMPSGDGSFSKPFANLRSVKDFCKRNRFVLAGKQAVVMALRGGMYPLTKSLVFDKDYAAVFQNMPVLIRPYASEYVAFNGGVTIHSNSFKKLTDEKVMAKLPAGVASRLRQVNISLPNGPDIGHISPFGFQRPLVPPMTELFFDKQPMQLARYPNDTAAFISKSSPDQMSIGYTGNRPDRWKNATDAWIGGFFAFAWADDAVPLRQINTATQTISLGLKPIFGISAGADFNRWYAFNLLEELDAPGEYFIDKEKKLAYFYPPAATGNLEISLLADPMLVLNSVKNIRFENISFENTRGNAVSLSQCENIVFDKCTFRNIGLLAVSFGNGVEPFVNYGYDATKQPTSQTVGSLNEYLYHNTAFNRQAGKNNGLNACQIYNTGNGGVSLGGGDRKTLQAAGNYIKNSDIHHCNRLGKTYKGAVNIDGVGNILTNNHLHHTCQVAIYLHGNNHLIQNNEVDHCCSEANDMAAFYMGYDPSEVGNIFSGNYFHDIVPRQPGYYVGAMFFDDGASNMSITNNVFYKTGTANFGAISINGGFGFNIRDNLFVDCPQPIRVNGWDIKKWNKTLQSDLWQDRLYKAADVRNTAYTAKYPWLRSRLQSPVASLAEKNIAINSRIFANGAIMQKNNCIATATVSFRNAVPDFAKALQQLTCAPAAGFTTNAAGIKGGLVVSKTGNPFDPYL